MHSSLVNLLVWLAFGDTIVAVLRDYDTYHGILGMVEAWDGLGCIDRIIDIHITKSTFVQNQSGLIYRLSTKIDNGYAGMGGDLPQTLPYLLQKAAIRLGELFIIIPLKRQPALLRPYTHSQSVKFNFHHKPHNHHHHNHNHNHNPIIYTRNALQYCTYLQPAHT